MAEALHNTIRSRFKTQVELPQSLTGRVVYDNAPDEHPDDQIWVRWTVRIAETRQVEIPATYRTQGIAIAQIFQPTEQGDKEALALADAVELAFRAVTDNGVRFKIPSVRTIGREGSWWQVNVVCPFYCDERT